MATLSAPLPALSSEVVSLYYTNDALLENLPVIIFYGPSTTSNTTHNSSRIQAHIYSLAGFQSFARLTVAPTSPVYAAVHHLPSEKQGDEVYRGLAVSLLSYFAGIPKATKESLKELVARRRHNRLAPAMFDEMHAGDLAANMVKVDDSKCTAEYIVSALFPQTLSWVDMDIKLPVGTIKRVISGEGPDSIPSVGEDGLPLHQYGKFTSLINSLGVPTFLPTSSLKRAPSKPTAHARNSTLAKDQKVKLRQDMCELVDTERRYIEKLDALVHTKATSFEQHNDSRVAEDLLRKLFPKSLAQILEINTGFCEELEEVLGNTEEEAIKDIEGVSQSGNQHADATIKGRPRDITGATAFAKTLVNWLPRLKEPYQHYMESSIDLSSVFNEVRGSGLAIAGHVQAIGEQHLRSLLIEPVQRLPRYSLLIDSIINVLPSSHTAMASFLKAKDLVTDICALDTESSSDNTHIVYRMRSFVDQWPSSLSPKGRFITAVDACELLPPFSELLGGQPSILLLFSDFLVLLSKVTTNALSARGLLAEVERPTPRLTSLTADPERGLMFATQFPLAETFNCESENGRFLWLAKCGELFVGKVDFQGRDVPSQTYVKAFFLESTYEGKAVRLSEEIVKARIESRFSETLRDSDKWSLRTVLPASGGLGILAAVYEDAGVANEVVPHSTARVCMHIGGPRTTKSLLNAASEVDIAFTVSLLENGSYRLDCRTIEDITSTDISTAEDMPSLLSRRMQHMLRNQYQSQSGRLATLMIARHQQNLRTIPIQGKEDMSRGRFRPISPVKILSNLLGGGPVSQPSSPSKTRDYPPIMREIPRMLPPLPSNTAIEHSKAISSSSSAGTIQTSVSETKDSLRHLEDTFATFMMALRSRSGNIVGRVLRGRAAADELSVNELYNTLVEDPTRIRAAAEVAVDVLFVAFEKFLRVAWRERMGPLLPQALAVYMQSGLDTGRPNEFVERFRSSLEEMTPQNRRTFTATIKLLSELLEASGNDGDRGALMASFAEALIVDETPHDYITLLDRLVDDYEILFESNIADDANTSIASDSLKRHRSVNTGSLSSNASSLRRKFGFGTLSRENSKSESESKVASVWRTLSKNTKSPGESHSQPGSISKGTLLRSRSTDTDTRMLPPLRPASRDRPITSGAASHEEPSSRPGSSHRSMAILSTIGEGTPTKTNVLIKKKRRSSLSDLKPLTDSPSLSAWVGSPSQLRTPTKIQLPGSRMKSSPMDQNISQEVSTAPDSSPSLSRTRCGSPERLTAPQQQPTSTQRFGSLQQRPPSPRTTRIASPKRNMNRQEEVANTATPSPTKRKTSQTGIPAPKGLSERQWPPNGTTPPKKTPQSPQKLKMQSPQKLRERLSNEHKSHATASAELQAELAAIGSELSALKFAPPKSSHITPIKPLNLSSAKTSTISPSKPLTLPSFNDLSARLDQLAQNLTKHTSTTTAQLSGLKSEATNLTSQLDVSNRKIKKLDALYREANAENEALYERFNDELGKILGRVKKGEGVQVLKDRIGELEKEVTTLREERRALKREAVERGEDRKE